MIHLFAVTGSTSLASGAGGAGSRASRQWFLKRASVTELHFERNNHAVATTARVPPNRPGQPSIAGEHTLWRLSLAETIKPVATFRPNFLAWGKKSPPAHRWLRERRLRALATQGDICSQVALRPGLRMVLNRPFSASAGYAPRCRACCAGVWTVRSDRSRHSGRDRAPWA